MEKKALSDQNKKRRAATIAGAISVLLVVLSVVYVNHPYFSPQFAEGSYGEYQGVFFSVPQPLLLMDPSFLPEGTDNEALLLPSENTTVEAKINQWKNNYGFFEGKRITLRGKLVQADNKVMIELVEEEPSLLAIARALTYPINQTAPKKTELTGEIITPKCWFGTRQNGERKVYSRCTKNALINGATPLLRVRKNERNIYYLLENTVAETGGKPWVESVGHVVRVRGEVFYQNGWNVLRLSGEIQNVQE